MSFSFEESSIWQSCLLGGKDDADSTARSRLRHSFMSLHERAGQLASEISSDLRDFTVHDVSHSDALWQLAGIIGGSDLHLNPLEAFILGCSFVVHDLGLALASYTEGLAGLQKHSEWKGIVKSLLRQQLHRLPTKAEIELAPPSVIEQAKMWLLRALHSKRAEVILEMSWTISDGTEIHLMDDVELRRSLGRNIGRVASSHGWPSEQLTREFKAEIGIVPKFPISWGRIDLLKIALLLRVADASHIDARRAPSFLFAIRKPKGVAEQHWLFQNKLSMPHVKADRLHFDGTPFTLSEAGAWWLCYDTLQMIDAELRSADNINLDSGRQRFSVIGVSGIESPEQVAQNIPTSGWVPIDAKLKVSNVASLVQRLGGVELYGENGVVPLRELLQNAIDAINARRHIEKKEGNWGQLDVQMGVDSQSTWVEVRDSGIGMTPKTLTGPFLDFGKSYWSTPEAMMEYPSLSSGDFESIGRFRIGFFSVFMWGERVEVVSRKFDSALDQTFVLTFENGLTSRPILRRAESHECLSEAGTAVKVWLREPVALESAWITVNDANRPWTVKRTILNALLWLCPATSVNIFLHGFGKPLKPATANKWLRAAPVELFKLAGAGTIMQNELEIASKNVRPLKDGNRVIGRACIAPHLEAGCITVGGLRGGWASGIAGLLVGNASRAARDKASFTITQSALDSWVSEQSRLIGENFDPETQAKCAKVLIQLGGGIEKLYIARLKGQWVTYWELVKWAKKQNEILILDDYDERKTLNNFTLAELNPEFLVEPLTSFNLDYIQVETGTPMKLKSVPTLAAIAKAWKTPLEELEIERGEIDIGVFRQILVDGIRITALTP